jgi:hypothetical protein
MAILNSGKTLVLNEIKGETAFVRILGTQTGIPGGSEVGAFISAPQPISLETPSGQPSHSGLSLENQVTFNVDSSAPNSASFPVSIVAVEIYPDNTISTPYFRTTFSNAFTYSEAGTFTLTQYNISVD